MSELSQLQANHYHNNHRKQAANMYKVIILVAAACLSLSTSSFSGAGLPQVRALTIASGAETQQKVSNTASSEEKSQVHE